MKNFAIFFTLLVFSGCSYTPADESHNINDTHQMTRMCRYNSIDDLSYFEFEQCKEYYKSIHESKGFKIQITNNKEDDQ